MQSDIYQKELIRYDAGEETSLGALISACVILGAYNNYEEAFAKMKEEESHDRYMPLKENIEVYETKRKEINDLYQKIWK